MTLLPKSTVTTGGDKSTGSDVTMTFATFTQLLSASVTNEEWGDIRSFLDECLPNPTIKQQVFIGIMTDKRVEFCNVDGWYT